MNNANTNPTVVAKPVEAVKSFKFPFERRTRSLSNPKQVEAVINNEQKTGEYPKKKSPSPECQGERNDKSSTRGPIIAKTDFTLHQ
jgi:hypothetical protein